MAVINLRDFYPWYAHDVLAEVSDSIVLELLADKRYHRAHDRRMKRNRVYSFDVEADMEAAAFTCHSSNPENIFAAMENHCRLCRALNSLPEIQGRRVEAYFLFGMSLKEIAEAENVSINAVSKSIDKGLCKMKEIFSSNFENIFTCGG